MDKITFQFDFLVNECDRTVQSSSSATAVTATTRFKNWSSFDANAVIKLAGITECCPYESGGGQLCCVCRFGYATRIVKVQFENGFRVLPENSCLLPKMTAHRMLSRSTGSHRQGDKPVQSNRVSKSQASSFDRRRRRLIEA